MVLANEKEDLYRSDSKVEAQELSIAQQQMVEVAKALSIDASLIVTVKIDTPQQAIDHGMGFVPEDRKQQGLFLNMTVRENIDMSNMGQVSSFGVLNRRQANEMAKEYVEKLGIRTPSVRQQVRNLSGGNQQKVVIA